MSVDLNSREVDCICTWNVPSDMYQVAITSLDVGRAAFVNGICSNIDYGKVNVTGSKG